MGRTSGIVDGEWDDQPRNWKTAWRRWRQSRERFRFEVDHTEAMSAQDFFVLGRVVSGQVKVGDALVVEIGDQAVSTRCMAIDHAAQRGQSSDSTAGSAGAEAGGSFHVMTALQLSGINPESGVTPGAIIRTP